MCGVLAEKPILTEEFRTEGKQFEWFEWSHELERLVEIILSLKPDLIVIEPATYAKILQAIPLFFSAKDPLRYLREKCGGIPVVIARSHRTVIIDDDKWSGAFQHNENK